LKQDYQDLLKPEIINSVSGLSLIARMIVDGQLAGLHNSRRVGQGMEFSQYRGYEPGDDLRLLDWKMLARSGRYYIKQAEVDTHVSVKFIVDASKSMEHTENELSKMEYTRVLVAALAYLSQQQSDAVGLFALNDQRLQTVYPKGQKQHFNRLLLELINMESAGKWPENTMELEKLHDRSRKELLFFITDLYENNHELTNFVKRMKTARNEVVLLHIMGKQELEFDYKGTITFEDLERDTRIKINAKEAKKKYLTELNKYVNSIKEEMLAAGITYELLRLNDPVGETLQNFLKKRGNLV